MNAIYLRIYTYMGIDLQLGNNGLEQLVIYASPQHNGSEAKAREANFISKC